jgi:hypothetical protein
MGIGVEVTIFWNYIPAKTNSTKTVIIGDTFKKISNSIAMHELIKVRN